MRKAETTMANEYTVNYELDVNGQSVEGEMEVIALTAIMAKEYAAQLLEDQYENAQLLSMSVK